MAFIIGLYSIHRLTHVVEEGEIRKGLVFQQLLEEMKRPILNFTTAGSLKDILQNPFSLARAGVKKPKGTESTDQNDKK
ncbi:MAG: hypothetical protein ACLFUR_04180 [Candidatus Hadarchaeia archaeon]